jgi:hypothetical protein
MPGFVDVNGVRVHTSDYVGQQFNSLTVIGPAFGRQKRLVTRCVCGNIRVTHWDSLRTGKTVSCGCMRRGPLTHGMTKTSEYTSWRAMCERCLNPNSKYYRWYGAEGVSIFEDWVGSGGFEIWLAHIGKKPSPELTQDRIDHTGNYEPGKVRWATRLEQSHNQRQKKSKMMTYRGETKRVGEWAAMIGVKENTLRERLRRGRTPEEIMQHPNNPIKLVA